MLQLFAEYTFSLAFVTSLTKIPFVNEYVVIRCLFDVRVFIQFKSILRMHCVRKNNRRLSNMADV